MPQSGKLRVIFRQALIDTPLGQVEGRPAAVLLCPMNLAVSNRIAVVADIWQTGSGRIERFTDLQSIPVAMAVHDTSTVSVAACLTARRESGDRGRQVATHATCLRSCYNWLTGKPF